MKDWIERAVDFTNSLLRFGCETIQSVEADGPMPQRDFAELQSQIPTQIPPPIKRFLTLGSASCRCKYVITIQDEPNDYVKTTFPAKLAVIIAQRQVAGGAFLCNSEELANWNSPLMSESMREANPEVAKLWSESFIFMEIGNGDFLGLHTATDSEDPAVVYLSHEEELYRPIAPNFAHFLKEWEKIFYLDPLDWHVRAFLNRDTGYIDANAGDFNGLCGMFR